MADIFNDLLTVLAYAKEQAETNGDTLTSEGGALEGITADNLQYMADVVGCAKKYNS